MDNFITIKLKKTWPEACVKYSWPAGVHGLPVDYKYITIAQMANKDLRISVKGSNQSFVISPFEAKRAVSIFKSVYTRKSDRKPVAVIPTNLCQKVNV